MTQLLQHPSTVALLHQQRSRELVRDAEKSRLTASLRAPGRVQRFFFKRHEGNTTWVDSVPVQRTA